MVLCIMYYVLYLILLNKFIYYIIIFSRVNIYAYKIKLLSNIIIIKNLKMNNVLIETFDGIRKDNSKIIFSILLLIITIDVIIDCVSK